MAEALQYEFSFKELAEVLIKKQGIHDGIWAIGFNLNIGTGLMGPNQNQSYPSAMVQVTSAILNRVDAGTNPLPPSAVDAGICNPRPSRAVEEGAPTRTRKRSL
ncbi:hypothetical protein MKK55_08855 [Methylobacterium sp. J-059]|uniref:hypothetical protein n=1 Tax=Methylobacterium sp. J-059 TaxID=2836643 RepID=UPI001FBAC419|nr:hypothetical protein [Methylobacterium sp. J-059]MCJ2039059.1 hypothetical protein [Methylobacterium sp. J-059]